MQFSVVYNNSIMFDCQSKSFKYKVTRDLGECRNIEIDCTCHYHTWKHQTLPATYRRMITVQSAVEIAIYSCSSMWCGGRGQVAAGGRAIRMIYFFSHSGCFGLTLFRLLEFLLYLNTIRRYYTIRLILSFPNALSRLYLPIRTTS